ncbi:hypothetical protein Trydic_g2223 [Trypoxylus dichotomus]
MKRQRRRRDEHEYKRLSDKYSDNGSDDEVELYPKKIYQEIPTVEKVVEEGDTLQSLAIQYGCSVAELKRLNHILNDNEIYAKGIVKVPDRPFSTILAGVHSSGRNSPNGQSTLKKNECLDSLENKLTSTLLLNVPTTSKNEGLCEEEVTLLPNALQESHPEVISKFSCSGADADISWIALIVCIIIVIVAVPLLLSFDAFEHSGVHHHSSHNT